MTLRFKFDYYTDDTQPMDISVNRDGKVTFNDRDIDYEVAFAAMSGDDAVVTMFLEDWNYSRWMIFCSTVSDEVDILIFGRFLTDCIEHILPIHNDDRLRFAIRVARDYFNSTEYSLDASIKEATSGVSTALRDANMAESELARSPAKSVAQAVYNLIDIVSSIMVRRSGDFVIGQIVSSLDLCVIATMDTADGEEARAQAVELEEVWQWRRFYDIMTALQAGHGWPDMGATP